MANTILHLLFGVVACGLILSICLGPLPVACEEKCVSPLYLQLDNPAFTAEDVEKELLRVKHKHLVMVGEFTVDKLVSLRDLPCTSLPRETRDLLLRGKVATCGAEPNKGVVKYIEKYLTETEEFCLKRKVVRLQQAVKEFIREDGQIVSMLYPDEWTHTYGAYGGDIDELGKDFSIRSNANDKLFPSCNKLVNIVPGFLSCARIKYDDKNNITDEFIQQWWNQTERCWEYLKIRCNHVERQVPLIRENDEMKKLLDGKLEALYDQERVCKSIVFCW